MSKVNGKLLNKLYKVELSNIEETPFGKLEEKVDLVKEENVKAEVKFADGEEVVDKLVEKGSPTEDNDDKDAKAEFADGEEVAQNFNGDTDSEKMLETSSTKYKVKGIVKAEDYDFFDSNIDGILADFSDIMEEHSLYIEDEEDNDDEEYKFFIEFKNIGTEKDLDDFERALEEIGADELQRPVSEVIKKYEGSNVTEERKDFIREELLNYIEEHAFEEDIPSKDASLSELILWIMLHVKEAYQKDFWRKEFGLTDEELENLEISIDLENSKKEVCSECKQDPCICEKEIKDSNKAQYDNRYVLIDTDGKVLSEIDGEINFFDTIDDEDFGYAKAIKFEDRTSAEDEMDKFPEREIEVLKAKDVFVGE